MRFQLGQNIIDFLRHKKKKERRDIVTEFHKKYVAPHPLNTYKNLIFTNGFGHSGSGAILDLLCEFDNTTVLGGHDVEAGTQYKNTAPFEFDFIRRYGGVFCLENICHASNKTYAYNFILNFINLIEYYFQTNVPIYNDEFLQLSYDFIDKLTDRKVAVSSPMAGNEAFMYVNAPRADWANLMSPYLVGGRNNRFKYYVKDLSVKVYRKLANEYLQKVFKTIESKENLVLDAGLGDGTADFDKYEDYVGKYKIITIYRDPRDVYMTGWILGEEWIPRDEEHFVFWYRNSFNNLDKYINSNDSRNITLRFEDLVLNYDKSLVQILNFLNIDKTHHIAPKTHFLPEYSAKNIGLYKNSTHKKAIEYIQERLKDYCYEYGVF